jgi:ABC-2 type transport system permease protein
LDIGHLPRLWFEYLDSRDGKVLVTQMSKSSPSPFFLLLRVNALQSVRRVRSLGDQSRLLTTVIILFVVGYITLAFGLFYKGLRFIGSFPGMGQLLIERLLFLLFAFLFVLLLFSNLVISYTNLFRNRETAFLLTMPVSAQTVYRWKFLESTMLASWAFLFLIAPMLAAYGLATHVPWHFYVATTVLVGLFIVLPAVGGSWCAANLARYMDRRAFQVAAVTVTLVLLVGARFWLKPEPVTDENLEIRVQAVLDRLMMKTEFSQFPLLPSYWLSYSVQNWAEGSLAAAGFFMLVLLSHVLFFGYLSFTRMGSLFYEAASMVQSRGSVFGQWEWWRDWRARRKGFAYGRGLAESLFSRLPVSGPVRALLVKDVRMFWRDTTQWGQTLVLFGLLGVYIINLRHFTSQLTNPFWIRLVSYLNLAACALNLATLTTRFVYPQFSLEGKRLWIVGMAPLGLVRVVRTKYLLACCASLTVTLSLITLSCRMLKLPAERTLYFAAAIAVMTFVLNGLAVGVGALYPNFKEDNPGKIVSGFGGTFCLVLSFVYIVGSVILLAVGSPWGGGTDPSLTRLLAAHTGFAVLSLLIGWLPLKLGLRKVKDFEH